MITVQGNGVGDLDRAVADLVALTQDFAQGRCRVAVADARTQTVAL